MKTRWGVAVRHVIVHGIARLHLHQDYKIITSSKFGMKQI